MRKYKKSIGHQKKYWTPKKVLDTKNIKKVLDTHRLVKELPMEQVMGYIIHLLAVASENDNKNLTLSKELLADCLVPPISYAINEFVFSINT